MASAQNLFARRLAQGEELMAKNLQMAELRLDQAGEWIVDEEAKEQWEKKLEKIKEINKERLGEIEKATEEDDVLTSTQQKNNGIQRLTEWRVREKLDTLKSLALEKDLIPLE